jgi:Flp pilus assembly protein TadD
VESGRQPPGPGSLRAAEERFQAGYLHLQSERYAEALVEFQRAAELDPTDARPHHGEGLVYQKLFLVELAEAAFQKAVELDPELLEAKKKLSTLLYDAGKYREAVTLLEPLVKAHPRDSFLLGELAINALGLGDVERAIRLLEEYGAAVGADGWGRLHLGRAYAAAGETARAEAAYREALALDPTQAVANYWLGQLLVTAGREKESEPFLETYRRLRRLQDEEHQTRMMLLRDAKNVGALVRLSELLYRQGKRQESLAALERARTLAPGDARLEELHRRVAAESGEAGSP